MPEKFLRVELTFGYLGTRGQFCQKVFRSENDYLAGRPERVFQSSWSIKDGCLWVKQVQESFELYPPFELRKPTEVNQGSPLLWMSSGYNIAVPIIVVDDDYGIIYVRVDQPSDPVRFLVGEDNIEEKMPGRNGTQLSGGTVAFTVRDFLEPMAGTSE